MVAVGLTLAAGCGPRRVASVRIANPWLGSMRVAVAPALNFSGSGDFDPNTVADLMASELAQVEGFEVLPVSRVLAVLAQQGRSRVESPAHALEIIDRLGADGLLVFAVTEYDPYEPPVVGIAAQLYDPRRGGRLTGVDPVLVSRRASPVSFDAVASSDSPVAETARVFNAACQDTARAVREYAAARQTEDNALGWRKYTASQQHYLRFCCYATIMDLVQHGAARPVANAAS